MEETATYEIQQPQKPDMLKVLCILSFVCCGLWILLYALGSMLLFVSPEMIEPYWEESIKSNPMLADMDPATFLSAFGKASLILFFINIFSLVGVIMMWRLEKIGFFIYAAAELGSNFVSVSMNGKEPTAMGMIFGLVIDLVFIGLYFSQLKFMGKKTNNSFVQ